MYGFDANIVTMLWEDKVQTISFTVFMCICIYVFV